MSDNVGRLAAATQCMAILFNKMPIVNFERGTCAFSVLLCACGPHFIMVGSEQKVVTLCLDTLSPAMNHPH